MSYMDSYKNINLGAVSSAIRRIGRRDRRIRQSRNPRSPRYGR